MSKGKTMVIDYKVGNLYSVCKALRVAGADVAVATSAEDLRDARRIVLPGVGHFSATHTLLNSGIAAALHAKVEDGTPFLGICVGLQWLFGGSTEAPGICGLGLFTPLCDRFPPTVKSPHVGWNSLERIRESRLLQDLPASSYVYYTHCYRAPFVPETTAVTQYGGEFTAAVERGNWMGVQFHPEKSGVVGLRILRNFMEISPC
jgi:imidazole glycerol-phosphate synthase subunit HisH